MGKVLKTMCKENTCCQKENEITKNDIQDNLDSFASNTSNNNKKLSRNVITYQISKRITQNISSIKTDNTKKEITILKTKTSPSLSFSLFKNEIEEKIEDIDSIKSGKDINEILEPKNDLNGKKLYNNYLKISNIKVKESLNNLTKKSRSEIEKINTLIEENIIMEEGEENENKELIINYEGEKCKFKGQLTQEIPLNGKGLLHLKSGEILDGNFIDGKLNNYSLYTDESGNIFEGEFKNGILEEGKITKKQFKKNINSMDTIVYDGPIKDFKKEGYGKEICDEYSYIGNFKNDMKNGKGKMIFCNQDEYDGNFIDDEITGYGTFKWKNNNEYTGHFLNGKMYGKGKYKWYNGNEYEGTYIKNKRQGQGKFIWKKGISFTGIFKKGKPDGKGIIEYKGKQINVEFKNERLMGNIRQILSELDYEDKSFS